MEYGIVDMTLDFYKSDPYKMLTKRCTMDRVMGKFPCINMEPRENVEYNTIIPRESKKQSELEEERVKQNKLENLDCDIRSKKNLNIHRYLKGLGEEIKGNPGFIPEYNVEKYYFL